MRKLNVKTTTYNLLPCKICCLGVKTLEISSKDQNINSVNPVFTKNRNDVKSLRSSHVESCSSLSKRYSLTNITKLLLLIFSVALKETGTFYAIVVDC